MNNFDGIIEEYPNIACDRYCGDTLKCTVFFLSHCHTDHMEGLHSPAFHRHLCSSPDMKLYCSRTTKIFLTNHKKYSHLKQHILYLNLNETQSVPVRDARTNQVETVNVTLLKANHCPGAVVIFFEGDSGNVMYTGDFRLTANSLNHKYMPLLYDDRGSLKPIKKIYIDTTFCSESAKTFPTRVESKELLLEAIEPWLASAHNHIVFLDCPYKFGCEYLFIELHKKLQMRVHVSKTKYAQYKLIPKLRDCTTDDGFTTRIHACRGIKKRANRNVAIPEIYKPCSIFIDKNVNIISVKLSAMYFTYGKTDAWIYQFPETRSCRVCYSIHASCEEIQGFVKKLRPRIVHPLVIPEQSSLEIVCKLLGFDAIRARCIVSTQEFNKFGQLQNQSLGSSDNQESDSELLLSSFLSSSPSALQGDTQSLSDVASPQWNYMISPIKASQESIVSNVSITKGLGECSSNKCSQKSVSNVNAGSPQWSYVTSPLKASQESIISNVSSVKDFGECSSNKCSQTSIVSNVNLGSPQWSYVTSPLKASQESIISNGSSVKDFSDCSPNKCLQKSVVSALNIADAPCEAESRQNSNSMESGADIINFPSDETVVNDRELGEEVEVIHEVIDLTKDANLEYVVDDSDWDTTPDLPFDV